MKLRSCIFLLLIVCAGVYPGFAQTEQSIQRKAKGKIVNQDELVSFKSDVPYSKAIQSLGELSKKIDGRLIIDRSPLGAKDKSIGINIESMYWKDALELILRSNQLWYTDYPEYMEIASFDDIGKKQSEPVQQRTPSSGTISPPVTPGGGGMTGMPSSASAALADSSEFYSKVREVLLSTIFFDLNRTDMAESGFDFSFVRGNNLNLGIKLTNASSVTKDVFGVTVKPTDPTLPISIDAALKMFEYNQLGELIARPQIVVRSGSSSVFQVGDDFSVLEKDFSGNTVQKFYPTGTILTVHPRVFQVGDMIFMDVEYKVEKSSFESSTSTTVIHRTLSTGSLTFLNGEEGYIGGMYSNETTTVRQGVPLLKDLPWWFFGLRYIFGYDSKKVVQRELIVIIKCELVPSLEERAMKKIPAFYDAREKQREMDRDVKRRTEK